MRGELPMSEENLDEYKNRIAELEQQLAEAKKEDNFEDIKTKYEEVIAEKDKEIGEGCRYQTDDRIIFRREKFGCGTSVFAKVRIRKHAESEAVCCD